MKRTMKLVGGLFLLATSLFMASCAQDGFDEESWSSSVRDQQLESPKSDAIVANKNADGSQWIITWPLVKGASGFLCTVTDVTDPDNKEVLFKDSLVDGCNLTFTRAEDTFYELEIRTIGNKSLNNKDAETASLKEFNSFVPTWKTVPAGSDIATWLAANPIPDEYEGDVCINLEPGASYTMSDVVDFGKHQGTIRSTVEASPASIKFTGGKAGFVVADGFVLKNLEIDASGSASDFITLSSNQKKELLVSGITVITEPIYIKNCKIDGIKYRLLYNNGLKYCAKTVIIDNSLIHLESANSNPVFDFYNGTGFINDFTITNTTMWNTSDVSSNYFIQYTNNACGKSVGLASSSVTFTNSTFYNLAYTQKIANYSGMKNSEGFTALFTMKECVFMNCSGSITEDDKVNNGGVPRYFIAGGSAVFKNNTYWFEYKGTATDMNVAGYDNTGTAILGNPAFVNPKGTVKTADFHMGGAAQNTAKIGDPRWLK